MAIRKGVVPTVLGTAVTATGAALTAMEMAPLIASGIVGFGLAHVVLGGLEITRHKNDRRMK